MEGSKVRGSSSFPMALSCAARDRRPRCVAIEEESLATEDLCIIKQVTSHNPDTRLCVNLGRTENPPLPLYVSSFLSHVNILN